MSLPTSAAPGAQLSPKSSTPWRDRPFLTLLSAAEVLGLSPSSLYRLEAKGELTFRRLGGRTLVAVDTVIALADAAADWSPSDRGAPARAKRSALAQERRTA